MVTTKKRQDFRIQLQKRARRRAEKKIEYLEDDKNWKDREIVNLKRLCAEKGAMEEEVAACKPRRRTIFQKMDTSMGLSSIASLSLGLSMSMTGTPGGAMMMRNLGVNTGPLRPGVVLPRSLNRSNNCLTQSPRPPHDTKTPAPDPQGNESPRVTREGDTGVDDDGKNRTPKRMDGSPGGLADGVRQRVSVDVEPTPTSVSDGVLPSSTVCDSIILTVPSDISATTNAISTTSMLPPPPTRTSSRPGPPRSLPGTFRSPPAPLRRTWTIPKSLQGSSRSLLDLSTHTCTLSGTRRTPRSLPETFTRTWTFPGALKSLRGSSAGNLTLRWHSGSVPGSLGTFLLGPPRPLPGPSTHRGPPAQTTTLPGPPRSLGRPRSLPGPSTRTSSLAGIPDPQVRGPISCILLSTDDVERTTCTDNTSQPTISISLDSSDDDADDGDDVPMTSSSSAESISHILSNTQLSVDPRSYYIHNGPINVGRSAVTTRLQSDTVYSRLAELARRRRHRRHNKTSAALLANLRASSLTERRPSDHELTSWDKRASLTY